MMEPGNVWVSRIRELHRETVARWHADPPDNPYEGFLASVCQQHQYNFLLWHQEDIARSPRESDARIAEVKRAIDGLNQKRNDWIEKLDDWLLAELQRRHPRLSGETRWNTETPGSAIDRLSILALREYHLAEQLNRTDASPEHRRATQEKLDVCRRQADDLALALTELWDDLFAGRKQLKVYRQLKMYNDPRYNPYLNQRP